MDNNQNKQQFNSNGQEYHQNLATPTNAHYQPIQYVYYPQQQVYQPTVQTVYTQPVQTVYQQPVYVQPIQPVYQQPIYTQPVQPVYQQPVYFPIDPRLQEKLFEKRKIRTIANWIGAAMLFIQLFSFIFGIIFAFFNFETTVFSDSLMYSFFSPLCLLLPFFICCLASKQRLSDVLVFEKFSVPSAIFMIMIGFAFFMVGGIISDLIVYIVPQVGESYSSMASSPTPNSVVELIVSVLSTAAIPALVEEFCFRGVVLGSLKKYGDKFAILASSLLFALVHSNFYQIPFAFFAGLIFGIMVIKLNSLWPPIILHFLNNAISVTTSYLLNSFNLEYTIFVDLLYYAFFGVIGLLGYILYRFIAKQKLLSGFVDYSGCLTKKAPAGVFYSSACIIITLVLYTLLSVMVVFVY